MGDMTQHFSRVEFACQGNHCCGHSAPIALNLVNALEHLWRLVSEYLGHDTLLIITSGFRCRTHNAETLGAVPNSWHTRGLAADVRVPVGMTVERFAALAETIDVFQRSGIGLYDGRIHVDVRPDGPARWDKRKKKP